MIDQFRQYLTKKNIIQVLLFVVLLAAIPIGVSLVKQQQVVKSKASTANIIFGGPNVKLIGGKLLAVDSQIKVKVEAPGSTSPTSTPTSAPTSAPTTAPTSTPTSTSTPTPTSTPTITPPSNLSGSCSGNTAQFSWNGASKGGQSASNYTLRVNKAPFDWIPNETCSSSTPTQGDCTMQVNSSNSTSIKLSSGRYGFSVQAGFADGTNSPASGGVLGNEFNCGQSSSNGWLSYLFKDGLVKKVYAQSGARCYSCRICNSGQPCYYTSGCENEAPAPAPYTDSSSPSYCSCSRNCSAAAPAATATPTAPAQPTAAPASTSTPTATATPTSPPASTLSPGVTINKFKVTDESAAVDADNPIWNFIPTHNYSNTANAENIIDFTFTPKVCTSQPCDPYPREDRIVFVQFLGTGANNTAFKEVVSAPITLALKPKIASASCQPSSSGTGTTITVKGLHFGSTAGLVTAGGQNTDSSLTVWENLQITTNLATPLIDQKDVVVATVDSQVSDPVSCTSGKSKLDFKASLSCRTVDKPLSVAELEVKDLGSVGVGVTSSLGAVSFYRNTKESFDEEGRPQGVLSKELEEGRNYSLSVKAAGSLRKTVKFTAAKGTTVLERMTLPLADISPAKGDNQVNAFDRTDLLQQWGKGSAKTADFNLDSYVNTSDLSCLMSNYGQTGDSP